MTPRAFNRLPFLKRAVYSALLWTAIAALLYLDAQHRPPNVNEAFFGFIIAAISAIASWLGAAGGAIATATVAMVQWLSASVGWLASRVGKLVGSSGAMFKKIWESTRRLWSDVIRPFLQRVYRWVDDLRAWLKRKLGPLFRLLGLVRQHITDWYTRFLRPILDAIQTARAILQILAKLHIPFAAALDRYLEEAQNALWDNFLRLLNTVNKVQDIVNSVVTGEMLFQRVPFLRTMQRDVRSVWRVLVNSRTATRLASSGPGPRSMDEIRRDAETGLLTGGGRYGALVSEMEVTLRRQLEA